MSGKWRKFMVGFVVFAAGAAACYTFFTKYMKKEASLAEEFSAEDEEIDFFDDEDLDEEPASREYLSISKPQATEKEIQPEA